MSAEKNRPAGSVTTSDGEPLTLSNAREAGRFEARIGNELVGIAEYQLVGDDTIVFPHTVVPEQNKGRGIAGELARFSLDEVRCEGTRRVVPSCSFFRRWIDEHAEYRDLTA